MITPSEKFNLFNASVAQERRQELRWLFHHDRPKHDHSVEWQTRRALRIEGNPTCEGDEHDERDNAKPLECHHVTYDRAGDEEWDDLQMLCKPCHARWHAQNRGHNRHAFPDVITPMEKRVARVNEIMYRPVKPSS
jgi:hypothetical protein